MKGTRGISVIAGREVSAGITLLRLSGMMSLPGATELVSELVAGLERGPGRVVVVDLARLAVPTQPSLLMAFPAALRKVGGWPHSTLLLAAPSPELSRVLTTQRISRYVSTLPTVGGAVRVARDEAAALRGTVSLPPLPTSPRAARRALERSWPCERPGKEAAAYVLHELSANAVRHVGQPYSTAWSISPQHVLVTVSDVGRQEVVMGPSASPTATGGRGLRLVDSLSLDWGVRLVHHGGKTVWSMVDVAGLAG